MKKRSDDADAFIPESDMAKGTKDDLAENLAQQYLKEANSGQEVDEESKDELLEEALGGPFVFTSPEQEFARKAVPVEGGGPVELNALPQAVGPLAIASPDEEVEAVETSREQGEEEPDYVDPEAEPESQMEPDLHGLKRPPK
jgi:hypothetical protein